MENFGRIYKYLSGCAKTASSRSYFSKIGFTYYKLCSTMKEKCKYWEIKCMVPGRFGRKISQIINFIQVSVIFFKFF